MITLISWLLIAAYSAIIAYLSLTSGSNSAPLFPHADKVMHFLAYMGFALVCIPQINSLKRATCAFILIALFGGAMELLQSLTPDRMPSILDMLANTLGAGAGAVGALWLRAKVYKRFF